MKKFENKKSFKAPKNVWVTKRHERSNDNQQFVLDGAVPYMVDGAEILEIDTDEGEIYIHNVDADTWLWLTPDMAEEVANVLLAWAAELKS